LYTKPKNVSLIIKILEKEFRGYDISCSGVYNSRESAIIEANILQKYDVEGRTRYEVIDAEYK